MSKKKKSLIAVAILLVLVIAAGCVWFFTRPATSEGAKTLTIEVVDNEAKSVVYTVKTDAEYLRGAMEDASSQGLTFEGDESEYGLYVKVVNGVTADYDTDGAYWAFYVDGEYCNYGVDEQPVNDGEAYSIVYEVPTW